MEALTKIIESWDATHWRAFIFGASTCAVFITAVTTFIRIIIPKPQHKRFSARQRAINSIYSQNDAGSSSN